MARPDTPRGKEQHQHYVISVARDPSPGLPVSRCEICQRTVAYRPGRLREGPDRALPPGPSRVLGVPSQ